MPVIFPGESCTFPYAIDSRDGRFDCNPYIAPDHRNALKNASSSISTVRFAHLVNPFGAADDSEFAYVQAVTLASMQTARAHASDRVQVDLMTAQFSADRNIIPAEFQATPDLGRSVQELYPNRKLPPLPLIADIMDRLYAHSDAPYLIYTNIDIALQPDFYLRVAGYIAEGHQALIINRRRIPGHYRQVAQLPEMYAEPGKRHPGFDCFVIHRDIYPQFRLGNVCVGIPFIGILMAQNVFAYGKNFKLLDREHLTFHIGEDVFKKRNEALLAHNRAEFWQAIAELWPDLDSKKWPWGHEWMPKRLIRWGLHPSLPIRLALKLELRRLGLRK